MVGVVGNRVLVLASIAFWAIASCGNDVESVDERPTSPESAEPSTTTSIPPESVNPTVSLLGDEEVVFDWSEDRCHDEMRPDLSTRAFRTADGNVSLTLADPTNLRLVGADFDSLVPMCPAIRESRYDPNPAHYDHFQWLGATYTEDGSTIHAVIHNEFHGDKVAGWSARRDFSLVQGESSWSYSGRSGGEPFEMTIASSEGQATTLCLITDWGMHPDIS